jgi:hypothetical protein
MTPETLSRALSGLEQKGKLQRGAGCASVADRAALIK